MKKYKYLNILSNSSSVCLISHIEPDADALSSMVVFREFLMKHLGIKVVDIFAECEELNDESLEILGKVKINKAMRNYHTAIMIDSPNLDRIGKYASLYEKAKLKIVIDHHQTNNLDGEINIVENVSSTCEIIYSILETFDYPISKENQGKLYAGIITDTNNFTVGNFGKRTFKICSEIIENIDNNKIYRRFLAKNSQKSMNLLSLAIQNLISMDHGRILLSHITKEQAYNYKAVANDFSGIINNLSTINPSLLVCFIYPRDNTYYVSMRSKPGYDISQFAKLNGGGGHSGAAAFLSNKSIHEIEETVLQEFRKLLENTTFKTDKLF
ncbi:MAG: hypothetical protein E7351_01345 [Clostridiales bacterium]|nr:hypothetical protein [Clostridiales bacterium]